MFVIQDLKSNVPLFIRKTVEEDPLSNKPLIEKEKQKEEDIISVNFLPGAGEEKQNLISIRSDSPSALLEDKEMDAEEKAHIKNFPGYVY